MHNSVTQTINSGQTREKGGIMRRNADNIRLVVLYMLVRKLRKLGRAGREKIIAGVRVVPTISSIFLKGDL